MHTLAVGHIVLVGLMGSGKTTVGEAVADALGVPCRDSDADIERDTGLRSRDLAARDGIDALHDLEARHLLDALQAPGTTVICTAASTIDDPACRAALRAREHFVVWLQATGEALAARLDPDDHRPEFGPDPVEVIRQQAIRRTPRFREVADLTLDATEPPEALAAAVVTHADAVR